MARLRLSFNIAIGQNRGRDRMTIQLLAQFSNGSRIRLKHVPVFIHECGIHYIRVVDKGKIKCSVQGSGFKVQGSRFRVEGGSRNAELEKVGRWEVGKERAHSGKN